MPRNISALVCCVIIAVFFCLTHINQQSCKIKCIGRCTYLVINYTHFIVCFSHINHSLDEILTIKTKHPCYTDNKVFFKCSAYSQLAFKLSLTVNIQRLIILAVRLPRLCSLSVKHIICGQIEHFTVNFFARISNILRSACIDSTDFLHLIVIFCHIHSRPSRTMNYSIRIHFGDNFFYRLFIGNIQLNIRHRSYSRTVCHSGISRLNIRTHSLITTLCKLIHHVMTELTVYACYKKLHLSDLLLILIHFFVVFLVIAAGDIVHPFFICKIPINSQNNSLFKRSFGIPAEVILNFCRINTVSSVVT